MPEISQSQEKVENLRRSISTHVFRAREEHFFFLYSRYENRPDGLILLMLGSAPASYIVFEMFGLHLTRHAAWAIMRLLRSRSCLKIGTGCRLGHPSVVNARGGRYRLVPEDTQSNALAGSRYRYGIILPWWPGPRHTRQLSFYPSNEQFH